MKLQAKTEIKTETLTARTETKAKTQGLQDQDKDFEKTKAQALRTQVGGLQSVSCNELKEDAYVTHLILN